MFSGGWGGENYCEPGCKTPQDSLPSSLLGSYTCLAPSGEPTPDTGKRAGTLDDRHQKQTIGTVLPHTVWHSEVKALNCGDSSKPLCPVSRRSTARPLALTALTVFNINTGPHPQSHTSLQCSNQQSLNFQCTLTHIILFNLIAAQ